MQSIERSWRRWARLVALAIGMACAAAGIAQSLQPVPPLAAHVTDLTNTLSADQKSALESQLTAFEQRKGSQVVVLIVNSTQPEPIEDYSIRVAEAWKIGRGKVDGKKVDDGVIVLVAKADRKIRIEVGYGLEGAIPDALASRIISEAISPRFRQGDFFGGLQAAVTDVTRLIDGEPLPPAWQHGQRAGSQREGGGNLLGMGLAVLVGGVVATMILGRFLGSAAGGVGAGVVAATSGLSIVLAGVLGVAAFIFLLVFAASGGGLSQVGKRTYRSGPVFFPGGFGGGGGGGGGGFGGGGGGFGGGGASGDW